jgi:hypothetical protein
MNQIAILESLIEVLKKQMEIIEQQANDRKRCGNCGNICVVSLDTYCEITGEQINGHKACDKWYPDGLTREVRK